MSESNKMFFIHCQSPVHVGTGQGVGIIDMPIMRERVTSWPLVPGSSIKGVLREYCTLLAKDHRGNEMVDVAFGKVSESRSESADSTSAGSLAFTDGRMLAFPVASGYGTFAYVSCPMALRRLLRDSSAAGLFIGGLDQELINQWESILREQGDGSPALIGKQANNVLVSNKKIYVDEFEFSVKEDGRLIDCIEELSQLIFEDDISQSLFNERFMLVSDDAFQYFVTICCETVPRIRIKHETKTVDEGALWYEEYLPVESILYGIAWCDKVHIKGSTIRAEEMFAPFSPSVKLQIGGNASVGKGRISCRFTGGVAK